MDEFTAAQVLIVEDDPVCIKTLTSLLKHCKITPDVAGGGEECLEKISKKTFDLILMDLQLPSISGLEITRRIREIEKGSNKHSLIIALTASEEPDARAQCREAGMDGFLAKPIHREKLMGIVQRVIKK